MPPFARARKRQLLCLTLAIVISVIVSLAALCARDYCRSALLLLQLEGGDHPGRLAQFGNVEIIETEVALPGPRGSIRCRIYQPKDLRSAPALVVIHGIHRLGIDEPRLVHFARAFAQRGVLVLTPEIKDLENYRIDPQSVDEIGSTAQGLASRTGKRVSVMGLSFAGGLALLAAANPHYAPAIGSVICVGAYDDLVRVTRFFVTERIQLPDGSERSQPAEQYGALVLAYDHPEDLFAPADIPAARESLHLWLAEQYDAARAQEGRLSPTGKAVVEALFRYQLAAIRGPLLAEIQKHSDEMALVSLQGKLAAMNARVFLLHGTDDDVIPSSETLWLLRDIPASSLARVLITPAVEHVDPETQVKLKDNWELIAFMAAVFRELEREPQAAVESKQVPSTQENLPSSH